MKIPKHLLLYLVPILVITVFAIAQKRNGLPALSVPMPATQSTPFSPVSKLAIEPATQPLGTVIYGEIASTTFSLENTTRKPLEITRISTSCGCTSARADKTQLAPGESAKISVQFNPAVHKDDSDLGAITRTIYVETDNPEVPRLEATITATVIKEKKQ